MSYGIIQFLADMWFEDENNRQNLFHEFGHFLGIRDEIKEEKHND